MTREKLIQRVCATVPAFLAANCPQAKGTCILATALGIRLLTARGIKAAPLSVELQVFNPAWVTWMTGGQPGGLDGLLASGGFKLHAGDPADLATGSKAGKNWYGHVVVHLLDTHELLDLDARSLSRPERGIVMPPALRVQLEHEKALDVVNGCVALYRPRPSDVSWASSSDWTQAQTLPLQVLERQLRG